MWQMVQSGYAAANCLAGNTEADRFAEGMGARVTRALEECDLPSGSSVRVPRRSLC